MRAKAILIVVAIAAASIAAGANWSVYTIANRAHNADLLWNEEDAYIFISTSRLGWRRNLLTFVGDRMVAWLGTFGAPPTDAHRGTVVLRFGRAGVERFDFPTLEGRGYALIDGSIYVSTPQGVARWTRSRFVEPSPAEQQAFAHQRLWAVSFQNENGWSGHISILSRAPGATPFVVEVGGVKWTVVAHYVLGTGWQALDLQRGDASRERIWELAEDRREVTEREFEAFLRSDRPSEASAVR